MPDLVAALLWPLAVALALIAVQPTVRCAGRCTGRKSTPPSTSGQERTRSSRWFRLRGREASKPCPCQKRSPGPRRPLE